MKDRPIVIVIRSIIDRIVLKNKYFFKTKIGNLISAD